MNEGAKKQIVLLAEKLCHSYGRKQVLRDVSLEVKTSGIVGLLGPNGAGKTTTIRLLAGLLRLKKGKILLGEKDVGALGLSRRARLGLGYLPQEPSVFRRLSVYDNLALVLEENGMPKAKRGKLISDLLDRFGLSELSRSKADSLSGGERRRLEIARALSLGPRILLFDEPFAGIDPLTVTMLKRLLLSLAEEGVAIVITDHNIPETLSICNQVNILYEGRLLKSGKPHEVSSDPETRRLFLGTDFHFESGSTLC